MKKTFSHASLCGAFVLSLLLSACSDDSSSPGSGVTPPESLPSSSATADNPNSGDIPLSSSATDVPVPENPDTSTVIPSDTPSVVPPVDDGTLYSIVPFTTTLTPDAEGFYAMADVYKTVPAECRIAFVIRHAARIADLGSSAPLTEIGVAKSQLLGSTLASEESFSYASSGFVRTTGTCENIAVGRGETADVQVWTEALSGTWFLTVTQDSLDKFVKTKSGAWKVISRWAYQDKDIFNSLFYDMKTRGDEYVTKMIAPSMKNFNRVSILVSHDTFVMPLTVYGSNGAVDLRFYETGNGKWINYLSGLAVILYPNNEIQLAPVKGDEVGYMHVEKDSTDTAAAAE